MVTDLIYQFVQRQHKFVELIVKASEFIITRIFDMIVDVFV